MEKRPQRLIKIGISGPESTAKTTLTMELGDKYKAGFCPELARSYIEELETEYGYGDVEKIAREQIFQYESLISTPCRGLVFFDTWLEITKIWFLEVYGKMPDWLPAAMDSYRMDMYLLCYPDIEWVPDPVRENGGEKRYQLFESYEKEIKSLGIPYYIIRGKGSIRIQNAVNAVDEYLKNLNHGKI